MFIYRFFKSISFFELLFKYVYILKCVYVRRIFQNVSSFYPSSCHFALFINKNCIEHAGEFIVIVYLKLEFCSSNVLLLLFRLANTVLHNSRAQRTKTDTFGTSTTHSLANFSACYAADCLPPKAALTCMLKGRIQGKYISESYGLVR